MNEYIDMAMNFINENTTLLIIVCVFLIFVLVIYLIDNSIKTKKLEKKQLEVDATNIVKTSNEEVKVEPKEEVKEEQVLPPIPEKVPVPEETTEPVVPEVPVPETPVEEPVSYPVESTISVEPEVNENLSNSFNNNENIVEVESSETKVEEPVVSEVPSFEESEEEIVPDVNLTPVKEPEVTSIPEPEVSEPVISEPIVPETVTPEPEEKPKYSNDKSISDIFSKKKEETKTNDIDEAELDRILREIENINTDYSNDSTIDETQDYSNMF